MFLEENGAAGRVRLGWASSRDSHIPMNTGLRIETFKPNNLVHDRDFNLKMIDFDTVIQVQDESTEIKGYWGTEGWTAPEIGKARWQTEADV